MGKQNLCPFGIAVKKRLIDIGQTQKWLIDYVRADTGLYADNSLFSKIMAGKRQPQKIISSICKAIGLDEPESEDTRNVS